MRLRGIKDLLAANALLRNGFLEAINERFAHSAASRVDYHRPVPKGLKLEDVFVFEEQRTVQNDWTVVWDSRFFQITGPRAQMPQRREKILVRRQAGRVSRVLLRRGRALEFHEIQQRPLRTTTPVITQRLKPPRPALRGYRPSITRGETRSPQQPPHASRERQMRASVR